MIPKSILHQQSCYSLNLETGSPPSDGKQLTEKQGFRKDNHPERQEAFIATSILTGTSTNSQTGALHPPELSTFHSSVICMFVASQVLRTRIAWEDVTPKGKISFRRSLTPGESAIIRKNLKGSFELSVNFEFACGPSNVVVNNWRQPAKLIHQPTIGGTILAKCNKTLRNLYTPVCDSS